MKTDSRSLLNSVTQALDSLIAAAEPYYGLFPSLLNRETGAMLRELPAPIPGQRNGDRAPLGSNLMHDEVFCTAWRAWRCWRKRAKTVRWRRIIRPGRTTPGGTGKRIQACAT